MELLGPKALSFTSHIITVVATQIHDIIFNTIHHCVTEDSNKSYYVGLCVKAANKEHKV